MGCLELNFKLQQEGEVKDSVWDDDDTRTFYESLRDLQLYVPKVLLTDSTSVSATTSEAPKDDGKEKEKDNKEKEKEKPEKEEKKKGNQPTSLRQF